MHCSHSSYSNQKDHYPPRFAQDHSQSLWQNREQGPHLSLSPVPQASSDFLPLFQSLLTCAKSAREKQERPSPCDRIHRFGSPVNNYHQLDCFVLQQRSILLHQIIKSNPTLSNAFCWFYFIYGKRSQRAAEFSSVLHKKSKAEDRNRFYTFVLSNTKGKCFFPQYCWHY